jgi:hypothetical protein
MNNFILLLHCITAPFFSPPPKLIHTPAARSHISPASTILTCTTLAFLFSFTSLVVTITYTLEMMPSLQRRAAESSDGSAAAVGHTNKGSRFENCFSTGLDLSEFATSAVSTTQARSAASELMQIKAHEHKEEAELQKRIAEVHATTKSNEPTYELSLRAENPHSSHTIGSERDDNFLKFANGSSREDNGFISCLVQNHNSEKSEFSRSQRALSKSKSIRSSVIKSVGAGSKGLATKSAGVHKKSCSGKKLSAKKASKSKF